MWVTKWSRESTQAFIINLSGSNRIPSILAPLSSCPPSCSPPLGGHHVGVCVCVVVGMLGGGYPILRDCTTVIIQLCSLFFSVKRPWYHYHLMNIYNWILAAASPWSDEYHSLFIRPLLILLYPASITEGRRAADDDDDVDDVDDDDRGNLKWSLCLFNAGLKDKCIKYGFWISCPVKGGKIQKTKRNWVQACSHLERGQTNFNLINKDLISQIILALYMQLLPFPCFV